jgi:hypothetical protein
MYTAMIIIALRISMTFKSVYNTQHSDTNKCVYSQEEWSISIFILRNTLCIVYCSVLSCIIL